MAKIVPSLHACTSHHHQIMIILSNATLPNCYKQQLASVAFFLKHALKIFTDLFSNSHILTGHIPARPNVRRSPGVWLALGHRQRRWPSVGSPLGRRLVFAGMHIVVR